MPVTALVSAKSCGVTAAALALTLASKRPSLLAECDPAGGTIRAGLLGGQVNAGFGLYHLARAERTGPEALANAFASHLCHLDQAGHRKLLPGLTDPAQAAALARTWPALADVLHVMAQQASHDVYIDAGRLALEAGHLHPTLTPAPLLYRADMVLLVVRGTEQSLALARHVIPSLRTALQENGSSANALGLLLIEDGPFRAHQVGESLQTPVIAALPHDQDVAHYLTAGGHPPRGYGRSALLRYARTATEQIEVAASRRQFQQYAPPAPQLAGILQRLNQQHTEGGVKHG
ncbi:hypothetical protein OG426_55205 (plasmid) [Streptomyces canus]|uniref:hypothetical protein n=1 Tax=Streptomyces canus TaxID=58343 RepID=UPI002F912796|nr:hypothetical protein OG426_55205 [Streptomyces canus]